MQEQFVLKTTAHWKALSHPLRVAALRLLGDRAMTNEELAQALCVESGKLYFHTKQLLDAGMIELVETRAKGPITEKLYQAIARYYVANELPDTEAGDPPPFDALLTDGLTLYRRAWRRDPGLSGRRHYAYQMNHRLSEDRAREFVRRFRALVEEFKAGRTEDPDVPMYNFALLFHAMPPGAERSEE